MTNIVKTPVMVLQELTVKKNMHSPEYSLVHARQGTHDNEFHYQVFAANISAMGIGRSKQVAKHDAARLALEKLEKLGIYCPGETVVKVPRIEIFNTPVTMLTVNSVGSLGDVCAENKIPMPVFTEISDVGPPHCKEFTYQCQVASIATRATSSTKKQAKQLAAKDMLVRIMDVLPELVAECSEENPLKAIKDTDEAAIDEYMEVKRQVKPNFTLKIEDYDMSLRNMMQEKNIEFQSVAKYLNSDLQTEETLKMLLDTLDLDYAINTIQEVPVILTLTISMDVPFTVLAADETYDACLKLVLNKVFTYLKVLIGCGEEVCG